MIQENAPQDPDTAGIRQWITTHLGGTVTRLDKLPRWRPSWNVEVSLDGSALSLHVRGERGAGLETQPLDMEMRILQILGANGIPVPKVYGWCDNPRAIVMQNVPGEPYAGAELDPTLLPLVEDYVSIMADIHHLDISPFVDAGLTMPSPICRWQKRPISTTRLVPIPWWNLCAAGYTAMYPKVATNAVF